MLVSLRFRHLAMFLLSWLFSTWGTSMYAQGHPELKAEDFTLVFLKGNSNCGTPPVARITYANRVAGFTKLTYKLAYTNTSGTEVPVQVSTTNIGQPYDIVFPADAQGNIKDRYIYVEAEYGGSTPETTKIYFWQQIESSFLEDEDVYLRQEGMGTCAFDLTFAPYSLSGMKEFNYEVYDDDNTLVHSGNHLDPYKRHKLTVHRNGRYTYKVTLVPDCISPTRNLGNTSRGEWDENNFVMKPQDAYTNSYVQLDASQSVYFDNCVEGVQIYVAPYFSLTGVSSITYEVRKYGETALLKSVVSTDAPSFKATIKGVPKVDGNYEVTAIPDCGSRFTGWTYAGRDWSISSRTTYNLVNCATHSTTEFTAGEVYGFSSMTYKVYKKDETAPFKTVTSTKGDDFKAILEDLPAGEYNVVGTSDCGVERTASFTISPPEDGYTLNTRFQDAYRGCPVKFTALLYVPADVNVTYELSYKGRTLASQTGRGGEQITMEFLLPDETSNDYLFDLVTKFCGYERKTRESVYVSSYPDVRIWEQVKPSGLCIADGSVQISRSGAMRKPGTLEVYSGGALVHTESVDADWSSTVLTGISAGEVKARLSFDCGTPSEGFFTLTPTDWNLELEVKDGRMTSYCEDYTRYIVPSLTSITNSNLPETQVQQAREDFKQGTYEVYQGNTLVASGNYADIPSLGIAIPGVGRYRMSVRSHCTPSVVISKDIEIKEHSLYLETSVTPSSGCVNSGKLTFRVYDTNRTLPEGVDYFSGYYTWELVKDGSPYATGEVTEIFSSKTITSLPAGKYQLKVFVTCEPSISVTKEFEVEGALQTPPLKDSNVTIRQVCGSLLGRVGFYFTQSTTDITSWDVRIVRKSDNAVMKELNTGVDPTFDLPAGDYRLTYAAIGACPYPALTYDFSIRLEPDPSKVFKLNVSSVSPATSPMEEDGNVSLRLTSTQSDKDMVLFKLISVDGAHIYTQYGRGNEETRFYRVAPGLYKATATFEGRDCEISTEVAVGIEKLEVYDYPDFPCEGSTTPLGLGLAVNPSLYDFSSKTLTFKVYKRTAPGAFTFTNVASQTEATGKTWTYIPGVLDEADYEQFQIAVEMDGTEIYRGKVVKPSYGLSREDINVTSTPTQYHNNVDHNQGTITAVLRFQRRYSYQYLAPFGGTHTWTLKNNTGYNATKTSPSPFTPVTFDNLPGGSYTVTYSYDGGGCDAQKYTNDRSIEVASNDFALTTTIVNATCENNASITVQARDVVGIQLLHYTLKRTGDPTGQVQSTSTPNVAMTFPNLAPGQYTLVAEATYAIGGTPSTITSTIDVSGTSPIMNLEVDARNTRPSLKGCRTGCFAFKFTDDEYRRKLIDENYKFFIIEAPAGSGITVPMEVERGNPTLKADWRRGAYSKLMNFPKGHYKFRVVNQCKSYEFTYELPEMEQHPITSASVRSQCESDGKYRITEINLSTKDPRYWEDLFRYSIVRHSGAVTPPMSYEQIIGQEFSPEKDKVKISVLCSGFTEYTPSNEFYFYYNVRQECGKTYLSGTTVPCTPRTLVVENLDAPVGLQEVHRGVFTGSYVYEGGSRVKFTILNSDNAEVWTETVNPLPETINIYVNRLPQKCDVIPISISAYGGCPGLVRFKIYRGTGAAKEAHPFYESAQLEKEYTFDSPLFKDYTLEAYHSNGTLIHSQDIQVSGYTPISDFELYNEDCGYNYEDGKYRVDYVKFKYPPLLPNTIDYVLPATKFYLVKGNATYIGELSSDYLDWDRAPGKYSRKKEVRNWTIVRYKTTQVYSTNAPTYEIGETIRGVTSQCDGKVKRPIVGQAMANTSLEVSIEDGWTQTCDGWNLVVPNKAYYTDKSGVKRVVNVTGYNYIHPVTRQAYQSPTIDGRVLPVPRDKEFSISLEGGVCGFTSKTSPKWIEHTLDLNRSLSYFCSKTGPNGKGKHYVQAKDGVPPYTYTFYDGPKGSGASPIPSTAASPNPQTSSGGATFDWGDEDGTYMVEIKDACGNLTIQNNLTVLSMANLISQLNRNVTYCAGENVTLAGQPFPSATYRWTLPTGSTRILTPAQKADRILTLSNIQPSDAGVYLIEIWPSDCAISLQVTFTLNVDKITPPATTATSQTICKGNPVTFSPGASSAMTNGLPGRVNYQWYESRDGVNFTEVKYNWNDTYTYPAQQLGPRYFKRRDTYKNCSKETAVYMVTVTESPIQTFKPSELAMKSERDQRFTLPAGIVRPSVGVTYLWERSDDGVSGWTPVSTDLQYEETKVFPDKQRKVFYRRTATLGSCSVTSPNIRVQFPSSFAPMINPHLRLRVKK